MILRTLKWLVTPQPRRLADIGRDAGRPDAAAKPELGMEAIDMKLVSSVARRNQTLERATGYGRRNWTIASLMPQKFSDDDTDYARKFHTTFQKGKQNNDR